MKRFVVAVCFCIAFLPRIQAESPLIHVFVALCDNEHQGIVPVPPKIGNGDDPAQNLYWGAGEGLKTIFGKSKSWKKVALGESHTVPAILERLVFRHAGGALLVADAYRGREIKQATEDYFASAAGVLPASVVLEDGTPLKAGGDAALVAYIGHNGLMDFGLEAPVGSSGKPAIVLCCKSRDYFATPLARCGARPILLTTQFMYPGSFILHTALEGWLKGETPAQLRVRAGEAYASNQRISRKAGTGVFAADLE